MYRIALYTTTGDSSTTTVLSTGDMTVKGWSKRVNAPGKMTFSMHKANLKATATNLRQYRRARLYRRKRDNTNTYEAVWYGYIEGTKQIGDEIEVVCVGMLQLFAKRETGVREQFNGQGSTEAFGLLTATNATDGATGITTGTGGVTSTRDLTLDQREISKAWEELAKAHDAEFEIDDAGAFNFVSALGTDKSATITLSFRQDGQPGSNVNELDLGEDGQDMANRLIGISSALGGLTSTKEDAASQTLYGVLIARKVFNEANDQTTLDAMTQAEVSQRANPITDLRMEPTLATKKFNAVTGTRVVSGLQYGDVVVGDTVTVNIVTPNRTISGAKRIAEITVDVDENGQERMRFTIAESGVYVTASYLDSKEIKDLKRTVKELEHDLTHPPAMSVGGDISGVKTTNFYAWAKTEGNAGIFQGNFDSSSATPWVEIIVQNLATTGTSDLVAEPDTEYLNETSLRYIDAGINCSAYDGNDMGWGYTLPYDGYLYVQSEDLDAGGNLAVGVTSATKELMLFAGGSAGSDVQMTISADGVQFGFKDENTTGGPFTYTTPILDMAATPKKTIDPSARILYFPDGTTAAIDWSVQGTVSVTGFSPAAGSITYAMIQDVSATSRILGRITAGAGDIEELTAANVKTILSLTSADVGLGSVENTALSTWAGSANITTVGTVGTGTWDATAIGISKGGTGETTAQAAIDALLPSQTGNNGKYLTTDGTNSSWGSPAGGGDVLGPASNTANYVPQWDGADSKTLKDGLAVGTGASNLVQLDGSAHLPAVDGSALTGLTATQVGLGTASTPQFAEINLGHASDTTFTRVSAGVAAIEGVTILTVAGGTLTGALDLGENAGLVLDTLLSDDGKYSGIVENGTAGATLAFGDLCCLDATAGKWLLADANVITAADGDCRGMLGICVLAGNDTEPTKMLVWGKVRAAAFPAFTVNEKVYVSETAGDVTHTQPTTTDVAIRVVGTALTAEDLFFNVSPNYITHV